MSTSFAFLLLGPLAWTMIWLIALINQTVTYGEVAADIASLELVGPHTVSDWNDLMVTAKWNRTRAQLKLGMAITGFVSGFTALGALFSGVPVLHSILNVALSLEFFLQAIFFLRLSYHDRAVYRVAAANRIRREAERGGVA